MQRGFYHGLLGLGVVASSTLMTASIWLAPIGAADFRTGDSLLVGSTEVIDDDLYVTGGTITIDGTIRGDVIAAGRELTINGTVEGDVVAAGQAVIVNGRVGDDIRMAGMALQLGPDATVGDDVVAAGFSLETARGSRIGGQLTMAGFQAVLGGEVVDSASFAGAGLELRGRIGGVLDARVEPEAQAPPFMRFMPAPIPLPRIAGGLTVAADAVVGGGLTYESSAEGRISPSAAIAGVVERTASEPGVRAPGGPVPLVLQGLRRFLALGVVGLLLAWIAPVWITQRADDVTAHPTRTLAWGLGVFLVGLTAAVATVLATGALAAVTGLLTLARLVGLVVVLGLAVTGLMTVIAWVTVTFAAPLVVSLGVGRRVVSGPPVKGVFMLLAPLIAGLALFVVLRAVPILGPVVGLLVAIAGVGSVGLWGFERVRRGAQHL